MTNQAREGKVGGFSLIELMIVITVIGILAATAIPGFLRYQMTSKRAEAYTNLIALTKAQKSYYAEFSTYVSVLGEPITTTGVAPSADARTSGPVTAAFGVVGWSPEGRVFFDYDTCAPGGAGCSCSCQACFTSAAWSDLDEDETMSAYMYFEPDTAGNTCQSSVDGHFPPVYPNGSPILQTPAWHGATDDY